MIQLHTLGDAVITIGDREVRPTSPTVFAALMYLGVERGQRVPRAALQELLFPETDERSGAHSLRQLLYKLRQLGAAVQAEGDVVWLASEDVVDDYSAPANTNGHGKGNGNRHRGASFLAGYSPRVSEAYDEWLETRRTAVEATLRRALIKHMLARRDVADWISVERIAQEILVGDPFNEEATFALAESTALGGSKSEAVRILERYESETGRADLKLPAAILRRRISERLPDRRRRALDTPFVGRDAEAEAMRQAIVNLRAGNGGSVVISGEPGIGKTRLIEETSALALLEGVNVHVVRCQPHYTSRPMGVFIEWVPMLMQSRGALGVEPETLEHLKLLTSHRDDRANRPTDARDDATRSGTLMAAVRDLVDAVASEAPIMLVVEDAHWADPASLRELCSLMEKRKGRLILMVLTTRVLEPLEEMGVIADWTQLLRLKPLVDRSMLDLSNHLLSTGHHSRSQEELGEWCATTAAGNPLYLQMLCAHYEDTQQPFAVPPGMRTATVRRIEQLPAESRRLLEFCALLGSHATLSALKALVELTPAALARTVQGLEEGGFLKTSKNVAQLGHDLLRECAIELVPPLTLKLLHGAVAQQLEAQYDATTDSSMLWDCAEHWAASGEAASALRFMIRCARHAADMGRASRALDLLLRSRRYAITQLDIAILLEQTSQMAKAAVQWSIVLDVESEVSAFQRAEGRHEHTDSELRAIEARWALPSHSPDTDALLRCARSLSAPAAHRVDAACLAIKIAHDRGDFPLAHEAYAAVSSVLQSGTVGDDDDLLQLIYHTSFGDRDLALRKATALRDGLRSVDVGNQVRIARNLSVALSFLGDPEAAFVLAREYYDISARLELIQWQFDFASCCCQTLLSLERFADAASWYDRAEGLRNAVTGANIERFHLTCGLEIALFRGDRELAHTLLRAIGEFGGESVRMTSHLKAMEVRVAQLEPTFRCPEATIEELMHLLDRTLPLMCADSVVVALGEALFRSGRNADLRRTLKQYVTLRRFRTPVPNQLTLLASKCGYELASN